MSHMYIVKETTLTVEKKIFGLVVPYFRLISPQSRVKCKKSLKNILYYYKLQILFKNKIRLGNNFHFKDWIRKILLVYKFERGFHNEYCNDECVRNY